MEIKNAQPARCFGFSVSIFFSVICLCNYQIWIPDLMAQAPLAVTKNDIFSVFVNLAKSKWSEQNSSSGSYRFKCKVERKFIGVLDQGESLEIDAKRLGKQQLVQMLSGSLDHKSRVLGINLDYTFELESRTSETWIPLAVYGDPKDTSVSNVVKSCLIQPDYVHLVLAPDNLLLTEIPWGNPNKVKLIGTKEIENANQFSIAELEFEFNFGDEVNNLSGRSARAYRTARIGFETEQWKPVYSVIGFESDRQKIECDTKIEYGSDGRISSRRDHLRFLGTEIESIITMNDFEWLSVPTSSEFRLPHFGLPEIKKPEAVWLNVVLIVTTSVGIIIVGFWIKNRFKN